MLNSHLWLVMTKLDGVDFQQYRKFRWTTMLWTSEKDPTLQDPDLDKFPLNFYFGVYISTCVLSCLVIDKSPKSLFLLL